MCINKLYDKIHELKLENCVEVIDDIVSMPEMYAKTHITVIPYLNLKRSPEIPLSAVESMACGRPVVTTDIAEIAEIVKKYKCGCTSKLMKNDFSKALEECKRNYQFYQKNEGELIVNVIPKENYDDKLDGKHIMDAFYKKVGNNLDIFIEKKDKIGLTQRGKHRILIQEIDTNKAGMLRDQK